ncbi:MAG: ATP-binding protein, partial [Myxococcota bacterium]
VNAAQAIPDYAKDENTISVGASFVRAGNAGHIEVLITDSGVGLPAENRGRIFEPFFTTKPQGLGTGLGLSVSIGIIERMGGTIELFPAEKRGTCARIVLPPAEATLSAPPLAVETVHPVRTRLLIIDDDERVGRAMKRMLSRDYDVETFVDGRRALDHLKEHPVDLVLCDVMMPGFSGIQLYREAQSELPAILERLVFITGGAFGTEARTFLETIPNPVLEKPVDFQALRSLVEERGASLFSPVVS